MVKHGLIDIQSEVDKKDLNQYAKMLKHVHQIHVRIMANARLHSVVYWFNVNVKLGILDLGVSIKSASIMAPKNTVSTQKIRENVLRLMPIARKHVVVIHAHPIRARTTARARHTSVDGLNVNVKKTFTAFGVNIAVLIWN